MHVADDADDAHRRRRAERIDLAAERVVAEIAGGECLVDEQLGWIERVRAIGHFEVRGPA